MFNDLAVTAISAAGGAIVIYVLYEALGLFNKGLIKMGRIGDFIAIVIVLGIFIVPMLYYFRKAGWI
jgi:hypothetical protein